MTCKIWSNREFKLYFLGATVLFFILTAIMMMLLYKSWQGLHQRQLEHNIAFIGTVASLHPELEPSLLAFITGDIPPELKAKGLAYAEAYGYTDRLTMQHVTFVDDAFRWNAGFSLALFAALYLSMGGIGSWTLTHIYVRLQQLSDGAEQMMKGSFDFRLPESGEGELPKLGHQFNLMCKRLHLTVEQIGQERLRLKDLISDISHQLKTPLSSLLMFNELLLEKPMKDEERANFLEKCRTQLERIEWLINALLKISRLEAGILAMQPKLHDIRHTVGSVVESLDPHRMSKRQTLRVSYEREDAPILYPHDRRWLGEALENIVKNAIEYTPEYGTIHISVHRTDLLLTIQVKDSGVGIDEKELPFVFKRFYQGERSKGRPHTSSGIGLALSKLIVEKHGGWIHAESTAGQGTAMSCIFPAAPLP